MQADNGYFIKSNKFIYHFSVEQGLFKPYLIWIRYAVRLLVQATQWVFCLAGDRLKIR